MDKKSNYTIALEILAGKWGNGAARRQAVSKAGYDFDAIQSIVNSLVADGYLKNAPAAAEPANPHVVDGKTPVVVDFDTAKNSGIEINIII